MVERTDDHPGTGSATYCSAVSLRQASRTLELAQRSYANNATTSSCMRISPGLGHPIMKLGLSSMALNTSERHWWSCSDTPVAGAVTAVVQNANVRGKFPHLIDHQ